MAFSREDLAAYEKQPQKQVDDKVSPFRGATPARAADPAAVAAVAAGQVDATPGGSAAAAVPAPLTDDSPVVDEEGNLGDPTGSGEGTSDANPADSSPAAVDPGDETDPNADLTGGEAGDEDPAARPAPKKGSAAERIVELNDLMEGYKVFGRQMQEMAKEALAENARLRSGGTSAPGPTSAAPPVVESTVEPMPDMADDDVQFDNDKYRAKMQKWVTAQTERAAEIAVRKVTGTDATQKILQDIEQKCVEYAKDHTDFEEVVTKNPVLAANKLAPGAGRLVAKSEHTAELLYRFGKDPSFAIRVARQDPDQQIVTVANMIRDIEEDKKAGGTKPSGQKPSGSQGGAKPAPRKSITQATPPPRPVTGGGRPAGREVTDPNMSMDEFARLHRASKQSSREAARKLRGLN